jgi:hypothetical protein
MGLPGLPLFICSNSLTLILEEVGHESIDGYSHIQDLVPRKYISKITFIKPNFKIEDGLSSGVISLNQLIEDFKAIVEVRE